MKVYAQILGTENHDSDASLLLFFDSKRYLFNVPEGCLRFFGEHKIKPGKINDIFLTSLSSQTVGGLPGYLLTMADTGHNEIQVTGPQNVIHYLLSLRFLIKRSFFKVNAKQIDENEAKLLDEALIVFKDENVTVKSILLTVPDVSKQQLLKNHMNENNPFQLNPITFAKDFEITNVFNESGIDDDIQKKGQNICDLQNDEPTENASKKQRISMMESKHVQNIKKQKQAPKKVSQRNSNTKKYSYKQKWIIETDAEHSDLPVPILSSACYICETAGRPGKFDPKKALALGLKPSANYRKLQEGKSVTLDNGTIISPEQVVGPPQKGVIFALIHCYSEQLLKPLVVDKRWKNYQSNDNDSSTQHISCIFHFTSAEIMSTMDYKLFMLSFGKQCQHIIVNRDVCPQRAVYYSAATLQCKLNLIDSSIFPLPHATNTVNISNLFKSPEDIKLFEGIKIFHADHLLKFTLSPQKSIGIEPVSQKGKTNSEMNRIPDLDVHAVQKEALSQIPELSKLIEEYKIKRHQQSSEKNKTKDSNVEILLDSLSSEECEIIFLGTGGAMPSKYRNVSGIYVHLFQYGGIILDCGEGTLGQLYRICGDQKANQIILNLKCVWISHMHADHHCGLAKLLSKRKQLQDEKNISNNPLVIVGPLWIHPFLNELEVTYCLTKFDFIFVNCHNIVDPNHTILTNLCKQLNLKQIFNVPVIHCKQSYALIMIHNHNWKVVYSGDTRGLCKELIEAGENATLLIHEANFEDSMLQEAISKKHSITREAIETGKQMGAYRVLLTHFSQRYPKIPKFDDSYNETTSIAFDFSTVNLKYLKQLPLILEPVRCLFAQELKELADEISER